MHTEPLYINRLLIHFVFIVILISTRNLIASTYNTPATTPFGVDRPHDRSVLKLENANTSILENNTLSTHPAAHCSISKRLRISKTFMTSVQPDPGSTQEAMPVTSHRQRPRKADGLISTVSSWFSAQGRSQKSELLACGTNSASNGRPFPFFKLPAELRNEIYRLVVVTGQNLIVQDSHIWEFEKSQDSGTYQSRSTYLATDHTFGFSSWRESCLPLSCQLCSYENTRLGPMRTTYTLGTSHSMGTMTTTMLSLNKESREEVAFLFYGENTFHFSTMSCLVPFMKDRTAETRKYVRSIRLTLTVDNRDWEAIFTEYARPATWNTAFSALAKLPHVNIKQLYIQIDDQKAKLLMHGLNLRSRSMLWLHKLGKIETLEMLGVSYELGVWAPICEPPEHWGWNGPAGQANNTQTEEELWRFLAPKMLREREMDDHSPDALEKRRIWDFSARPGPSRTVKDGPKLSNSDADSDEH